MSYRPPTSSNPTLGWLLAGAVLIVAGCAQRDSRPLEGEREATPRRGGTLVVATSTDIGGVNELLSATSSFTQSVLKLMFLKLLEEQPDFDRHPPTFMPQLAESLEWTEDRRTLTLYLRQDVLWSNGQPVTAADVEWTWRAQTHPEVAWALAETKENITLVQAIDTYTVEVTYRQENVSQLADLNEGFILPSSVWSRLPFSDWRQNADWFVENLVTDGPFDLAAWDRQQQIVLHRSENFYIPDRPYLDRIAFRIVPQKLNQVGHLLAGEVQFVDHVSASEAQRIAESSRLQLLTYWARQYDFICWNTARRLFAQDSVRRALTLAIDRSALVDALWFGHARISTSPIISSVWAHNGEIEPWPYDPQAAIRLLEESGWQDSDGDGTLDSGGEDFAFELITNTNSVVRVDAAVMIQEQLARVGIRMDIQRLEFNTLVEKSLAHDFDAMLSGWTIDTSLDLDYAFHSDSIDGGYNFGAFSDPRIDHLLDQVEVQTEADEKGKILREVQLILHQQQPYTFLWEPQRLTGTATRLRDAQPNALDPFHRLQDWWLEATR